MTAPNAVAVIGGGTMGGGIAQAFASAGAEVTVVEENSSAAEAAYGRISAALDRAAQRGKLSDDPGDILGRIRLVAGVAEVAAAAELVVEAVPEVPELKISVLAAAERAASAGAV